MQDNRAPYQGCDESGVGQYLLRIKLMQFESLKIHESIIQMLFGQCIHISPENKIFVVRSRYVSGNVVATLNVIAASGQPPSTIAGATHSTAAWVKHFNTTRFDRNFYAANASDIRFPVNVSFHQWQLQENDIHSFVGDAAFVNFSASDYRLSANSPARTRLGIDGPDYQAVGPCRTAALALLDLPRSAFAKYPFLEPDV